MKVTVYDVNQPERAVDGDYTVDITLGAPLVGDELLIGERDYNNDRHYVVGTVRRRAWIFYNNAAGRPELRLWVHRHKEREK